MLHFLLQITDAATATLKLADYGVLGITASLCISVVIYQERIRRNRDIELKKELEETRHETKELKDLFNVYQNEDRGLMLNIIRHNTEVMEEVIGVVRKTQN